MKTGEPSISLWFIHFISTSPINKLTKTINILSNNDKNWQEKYGPNNIFITLKNLSKHPNKIKSSLIITLIIITIIPLIIKYHYSLNRAIYWR